MPKLEELETQQIRHTVIEGSSIKAVDGEDKDGEKVFKIVISTNQVDRYGEVVNQDGIDITNYLKNPLVLWGHDYYLPPIGKAIEIIKQKSKTIAKFVFAQTQFAQEIKSLVEGGFVNMASIGFISNDYDREKYVHNSSELLEFSLVDVPANPGAEMQRSLLIKSMAQGIKELKCKEVEAYVCKKGDTGCRICSKIVEEIKILEQKDEGNAKNEPTKDDTSANDEELNKDIKDGNKEALKTKYELSEEEKNVLTYIENEKVKSKLNGEEEITEEEKVFLDTIKSMGLLLKKKDDIIKETSEEIAKAEKPLSEKINQLDDEIKQIVKDKEDKEEIQRNLIKISSKALNLALSNYNKK